MKEFEKIFPDSKENSGSQLTIARKQGWKEALKWVLSTAQEDSFDFLHHWEKYVSEEDKKIISPRGIKKELESE